ncbi:MAG TPA: hypothetical protein VKA46_13910, partial [Gemmataceae bacterium]|nr:hypothetical protein [Gemmataceae bacterium]
GGDASFLQAVAEFYGEREEEEDEEVEAAPPSWEPPAEWDKARLQEECSRRGVAFRKSWTKAQLRQALTAAARAPVSRSRARPPQGRKPPKMSRAARQIVDSMTQR